MPGAVADAPGHEEDLSAEVLEAIRCLTLGAFRQSLCDSVKTRSARGAWYGGLGVGPACWSPRGSPNEPSGEYCVSHMSFSH